MYIGGCGDAVRAGGTAPRERSSISRRHIPDLGGTGGGAGGWRGPEKAVVLDRGTV